MGIKFEVRDRLYEGYKPSKPARWAVVERKGRRMFVQELNEEIELFSIKTLAEALDREQKQIYLWEKERSFPKPLFEIAQDKSRRYYSHTQVLNCHHLWRRKYNGMKYFKNTDLFLSFMADIKRVFYARTLVVGPNGELP